MLLSAGRVRCEAPRRSRSSPGEAPSGAPGRREAEPIAGCFAFGGVVFELCFSTDPNLDAPPSVAQACTVGTPSIARVRLELEGFVPLSPAGAAHLGPRFVSWQRKATGLCVRAGDIRARLTRRSGVGASGEPLFHALLRAPRVAGWIEHACSAVHAAVVFACGGLVLHAASVWHARRVWAFMGPSGAGKSTAAQLLGGPPFSVDRLVLWPPGQGSPWVSALPGGTPYAGSLPARQAVRLPLAACLRVRQARAGSVCVQPLSRPRAFASLRESVFFGAKDPTSHQELLVAVERVCASVVVAELHFGLGAALPAALEGLASTPGDTS